MSLVAYVTKVDRVLPAITNVKINPRGDFDYHYNPSVVRVEMPDLGWMIHSLTDEDSRDIWCISAADIADKAVVQAAVDEGLEFWGGVLFDYIYVQADEPTGQATDDFWWDTTVPETPVIKRWDGAAWQAATEDDTNILPLAKALAPAHQYTIDEVTYQVSAPFINDTGILAVTIEEV